MQNGASTSGSMEALLDLPSLNELHATLDAVIQSPYPPRSVFIRASSNHDLLQDLLHQVCRDLSHKEPWYLDSTHGGARDANERPHVQALLPRAAIIDCAEIASTKALFARILNTLSGWGRGEWSDTLGGVLNWDGRQEGFTVQQRQQQRQRQGQGRASNGHGSQDWQLTWDYEAALDTRNTSDASKPAIVDRKDESMSAFLQGMRMVFMLGAGDRAGGNIGEEGQEALPDLKFAPRFVVLLNAEKLLSLETAIPSQQDGSLLAAVMRIGELTGHPVIPILTSCSDWLLLRPSKGATEPAVMLDMPALKRQDLSKYLHATILPELPASSNLTAEQQSSLLTSLIDLIHQTFEPYLGDAVADYLWLMEKLWPDWIHPVSSGAVEAGDVNRLVALFKSTLSREIEGLGELRPLLVHAPEQEDDGAQQDASVHADGASSSSARHINGSGSASRIANGAPQTTPKKALNGTAAFYANAPVNTSPSLASLPAAATFTPSRTSRLNPSSSAAHSSYALAGSLSLLSRYILLSAFLASSNPSRKDLLMLATHEDELLASKRKKKGGAMRKSPTKRGGGGGGGDDSGLVGPIRKKDTAVPQRLLGPKPFPLERLIAITETILPVELRSLAKSQDILQEVAHLTNLRLLLKTSSSASLSSYPSFASASSISPFDRLDGIKLKCSTTLELDLVEQIGRSVGFKVAERLWEMFG